MHLHSKRLVVRDLTAADLDAVHALLDLDLRWDHRSRTDRARWLDWTIADDEQRARVHQPPDGEYAVELVESGQLVGLVGLVPTLMPFGLLPGYRKRGLRKSRSVTRTVRGVRGQSTSIVSKTLNVGVAAVQCCPEVCAGPRPALTP